MSRELKLPVRGQPAVALHQGGRAPTLLLLHGAGGNHHSYDELLPHLRDTSVLVPALPGRCGSAGTAPSSAHEAALWLVDFLRAADVGPVILCGHSYGGALAIELALLAVDAIDLRGLVLIATGARLRVSPMILQVMEEGAASGTSASLASVALREPRNAELVERVDAVARLTPPKACLRDWRAANAFDRMSDLPSVPLPTLVIAAEHDVLTPAKFARYLADHIPVASLAIVPGAGHMLVAEEAAECATLLLGFAARTASASP